MSADINFVDAHGGTAHIDSNSIARKNQAFAGIGLRDNKIFSPFHNNFRIDVVDATHVKMWNGAGMIQGRFFYMEYPTTLEVKPGAAGLNRRDAIVFRYKRDGDGVETVTPMVITGTATSGQAALPATLVDNDIYFGSTQADLLFAYLDFTGTDIQVHYTYDRAESLSRLRKDLEAVDQNLWKALGNEQNSRVSADNANANNIQSVGSHVGSVENALNQLRQNFEVLQFQKLVGDSDCLFTGVVVNGVAMISGRWTNRSTFNNNAWAHWDVVRITNGWKTSDEYGSWSIDNGYESDGWFSINGDTISFRTRGKHDVRAATWHYCTIIAPVHK